MKNFEINNVHHVAFRCRDAEQTRWFYEDVLGLKLAAALSFDHLSGTDHKIEYMHIFFEMQDGNFIAFFDDPHNAPSDFFKDQNLQSDERYAESFVRVKFAARKGPLFIRNHRNHTGVDKSIIDNILSNYTEEQWVNSAVSALVKKYNKTMNNKDKMTTRFRQVRKYKI